jgi:hypothetical protein
MSAITCCIRYKISPGKESEFAHYAQVWSGIIRRLGGTYYGCFIPGDRPPDAAHFSFPEMAKDGPLDVATVIFSFSDLAEYERYRRDASNDPECDAMIDHLKATNCFSSYERSFVRMLKL